MYVFKNKQLISLQNIFGYFGFARFKVKRFLPSSVLFLGERWFDTDVSGLPVGPIFKGQAVKEKVHPWKA
jgi:hypothetical protein